MADLPPLRRNRSFHLLWLGGTASALGSSISGIAVPLLLLGITGSAAYAGLVSFLAMAAGTLVSLPAGVWVDRLDRRRILVGAELVAFAAWGSVVVADYAGGVSVAHVLGAAVVGGAALAFFEPAQQAAIRAVVPAAQLPTAFAQDEARSHAANLAGPPLGGLLFAASRTLPFLVDAISFLISAACVLAARVPRRPEGEPRERRSMRADVAEAAGWLWRQPGIRAAIALGLGANLMLNSMIIPLIVRAGEATAAGVVVGSLGVGGLAGALLAARVSRLLPAGPLFLTVIALFAGCMMLAALPLGRYWPVVPIAVGMLAVPALNVVLKTLLSTLVPDEMMGRVSALLQASAMALVPLSPLVGGTLAETLGGSGALLALGGLLVVVCAAMAGSRALRELEVPTPA
ncbi:MFS transporter [Nonomuraea sp. NPDC050310]|uniref:MFS transporter n=1 Tax=unclassified Nonomuraea TaxID=2593643 RepID=UPI0033CD772F